MMKSKLYLLAAITLLAALMFSGTVFAEGETPAAEPAPAVEQPVAPAYEAAPSAEPAVEPAEAPAAELLVEPSAAPAEAETPLAEPPAEIIEAETPLAEVPAAPAETEAPAIVVLDEQGDVLDMASQQSAQVIAGADPYFTSGGITYRFFRSGSGGCTPYGGTSTTCMEDDYPIQRAIDFIKDNGTVPNDGKIYVLSDTYTDNVTIDGALPNLSKLKGLVGVDGSATTTINGNVTIENTVSGFTLSGFTINGSVYFSENKGTLLLEDLEVSGSTDDGIKVGRHNGTITVKNVRSHNNNGNGMYVNNTAGGNVVIANSQFLDNKSNGFEISSRGTVSITNTIAKNNESNGAAIESSGVTVRNLIVTDNTGGSGLEIKLLKGAALLDGVVANKNNGNGVRIENIPNAAASATLRNITANGNDMGGISVELLGNVSLSNSLTNDNQENGVYISTRGAAALATIRSSGNGWNGLKVEGVYTMDGANRVSMASPSSVTLSSPTDLNNTNFFNGNGWQENGDEGANGISIISEKPVTIQNFNAGWNTGGDFVDGYGLRVEGPTLYGDVNPKRSGAVTIGSTIPNWRNHVDHNDYGVGVLSAFPVSLSGLESNENFIKAVEIDTLGAISLRDVRDWGNSEVNSIYLDNSLAAGAMPVNITNLEVRETRGDWGAALEVQSKGAITIKYLFLDNNNGMGAALGNAMDGRGNISITDAGIFNNRSTGLQVFSKGAILLTRVRADNNGRDFAADVYGAYLDNRFASTAAPVTLTDCDFHNTQGTGLQVFSNGAITLKGVEVQGSYIRNGVTSIGQTVYEINQPDWDGNGGDEWRFVNSTSDPVTIILRSIWNIEPIVLLVDGAGNEITADLIEDGDGIWTSTFNGDTLDDDATYTIRVLFDDTVSDGWGGYSLSVNDENKDNGLVLTDGALLDNSTGTTAGVTVSPTKDHTFNQFNDNSGYGLKINSKGAVILTNLSASNNAFQDGLRVETPGAVKVQSTSATDPVGLYNNGGNGIYVRTQGAITLANVNANNNFYSGADLDNALCSWDDDNEEWINCQGSGGITVSGVSGRLNDFMNNNHFGIWALSRGAIALTNVKAENNGSDGAILCNARGGSSAGVSVASKGAVRNEFNNNGWNADYSPTGRDAYYAVSFNGLTIVTAGTISVQNSNAGSNQNMGGGLMLNNARADKPKTVLISNVETSSNDWVGIWTWSKGTITLKNAVANENRNEGGMVLNNACAWDFISGMWTNCEGTGSISMSGLNVHNNSGIGLDVLSRGAITLTGAEIHNNWQGARLENSLCRDDIDSSYCQGGTASITISKVNAGNNGGLGLEAHSRGTIKLTAVEGSGNRETGVFVQNDFPGASAPIILSGVTGNDNLGTGISAHTNGMLTMTNLTARSNALTNGFIGEGQTLQDFYNQNRGPDNWWFDAQAGTEYTFTLLADGYGWDENHNLTLINRMDFDPFIELIDPKAEDGWDNPLDISAWLTCVANTSCEFTFDPQDFGYSDMNLFVVRLGSASGDGFYRLSLNDDDPSDSTDMFWVSGMDFSAGGNVVLGGNNSFDNNSLVGIAGSSGGNMTLSNIGVFNNGVEGAILDNSTGSGSISLSGNNIIRDNGWEGLKVETNGTLAISNLDVSYNSYGNHQTDDCAAVIIHANGDNKAVTLNNVTLLENRGDGLVIWSNGVTTLNNVNAWLNGWGGPAHSGAYVDSGGYEIKVINSSFMLNQNHGLNYHSYGPLFKFITINSVYMGNGSQDLFVS